MTGYSKFLDQMGEARQIFPSLQQIEVAGRMVLRGLLAVSDTEGKHWEDYEIEIHCSDQYPYEFPYLYEISGKIPRIGDWHIYEDTGRCCVRIHPEEVQRCIKGITIVEYIREEVLPYLFNQTHRRVEGYYINGEFAHGGWGLLQYYIKELNTTNDVRWTLELIKYIATHNKPHRTSYCFCGRKAKFRHCHKAAFEKLKGMGDAVLEHHYNWISIDLGLLPAIP